MAYAADYHQSCDGSPGERSASVEEEIKRIREEFEVEISSAEGDLESDLQLTKKTCKKNLGHTDFIPIRKFKAKYLPPKWRDPQVCDMIKEVSRQVVQLTIRHTSPNRPDGYCDHRIRGSSIIRVGTGRAAILEEDLWKRPQPCPIEDCREVPGPHLVTPEFTVVTAAHVVYDTDEARKTEVNFFVDSEKDKDKKNVIKAQGVSCEGSTGILGETSGLICVSHNLDLFRQVVGKDRSKKPPKSRKTARDPLIVIPSHPHGCAKQVSVGEWTGLKSLGKKEFLRMMKKWSARPFLQIMREGLPGFSNAQSPMMAQALLQQCDEDSQETVGDVLGDGFFKNMAPHLLNMGYWDLFEKFDPKSLVDGLVDMAPTVIDNFFPGMQVEDQLHQLKDQVQKGYFNDFGLTLCTSSMLYSTPTCPGSSGAPVMVLYDEDDGFVRFEYLAPHFGTKDKRNASAFLPSYIEGPALKRLVENMLPKKDEVAGRGAATTVMDIDLD